MAEKGGYNQPMVVVGQPAYVEADYTIPRAKVPAVMMLIIACFNGIAFLVLGIMTGAFGGLIEFIVSFMLYGCVGLLGTIAAFKQQRGQACVVAMIIFAVFAMVLAFAQTIIRALAVLGGAVLVAQDNEQYRMLGTVILIISGITLVFAILVFILTIVLIVFGSKAVCQCCGAQSQASGGVVYQAAPAGQQA